MNFFVGRIGIDKAVRYALFNRIWIMLSGALSLLLLTHFLSAAQQGYYFTFVDVLALQVFFELGLSTVMIQVASHEKANLEWTPEGLLRGDDIARSRLASMLRLSLIWYGSVAILMWIIVLPLGLYFFSSSSHNAQNISWVIPWVWILTVTSGGLAITPLMGVIEGCGLVAEVNRIQFQQAFVGSILFWITLYSHWQLYTAPITNTVSLIFTSIWIWRKNRRFLLDLSSSPKVDGISIWKKEVLPFQWRIALSWMAGYFSFRLFDILLFHYRGPISAGKMGLTITVMSNFSAIAMAWIVTKAAPFGSLVAKKNWVELDRRFFPCFRQSFTVLTFLISSFWFVDYVINIHHFKIASRLISPFPLSLLGIATVLNHIIFCEAIYLRSHKREPFLGISILNGVLVFITSMLLVKKFGITGIMAGNLVVIVVIVLAGTSIFVKKRAEWHRDIIDKNLSQVDNQLGKLS